MLLGGYRGYVMDGIRHAKLW